MKLSDILIYLVIFGLIACVVCIVFGILFALMGYFGPVLGIIIFLLFFR